QLHRWTWDAAEGAEHAAVAGQRTKQGPARFAFVEVNAGIRGHDLLAPGAAGWTGEHGGQNGCGRFGHEGYDLKRSRRANFRTLGATERPHSGRNRPMPRVAGNDSATLLHSPHPHSDSPRAPRQSARAGTRMKPPIPMTPRRLLIAAALCA